ncbi:hypothetical protein TNCV_1028451 [Trichonephila clavipes]|nr:hypothetical protein TNCV_1028451 [Trichonephila clavipes]
MLVRVYEDQELSMIYGYKWFARFREELSGVDRKCSSPTANEAGCKGDTLEPPSGIATAMFKTPAALHG